MTREDFFNLSKAERISLINRASPYYIAGWVLTDKDIAKIQEEDVREFIIMCNLERFKAAKYATNVNILTGI